jgi:hypothetical protein
MCNRHIHSMALYEIGISALWHLFAKGTSTPFIIINGDICFPLIFQLILIFAWGYGVIFHSFEINIHLMWKEFTC